MAAFIRAVCANLTTEADTREAPAHGIFLPGLSPSRATCTPRADVSVPWQPTSHHAPLTRRMMMTVTGFTELFPRATRWAKHSCDPHHGSVPQGSGTWARRALGCPQSRTAHLGLRPGSAPNPSFLLVCVCWEVAGRSSWGPAIVWQS